MSKLVLGISGLIALRIDMEAVKTEDASPFTFALKLFLDVGILE
jgi:hypothetical protein